MLQRRLKHGWNEFSVENTEPIWKKYLDQVRIFSTDSHLLAKTPGWLGRACLYIEIFRVSNSTDSALEQVVPRIQKLLPWEIHCEIEIVGSFNVKITP